MIELTAEQQKAIETTQSITGIRREAGLFEKKANEIMRREIKPWCATCMFHDSELTHGLNPKGHSSYMGRTPGIKTLETYQKGMKYTGKKTISRFLDKLQLNRIERTYFNFQCERGHNLAVEVDSAEVDKWLNKFEKKK